jgi:hypothetical protein
LFFSAALEGDDHRLGLAEDAPDLGLGDEAGEAVEVLEVLEFSHRSSMTRIPPEEKSDLSWKSRVSTATKAERCPLENAKSLNYLAVTAR